MNARRARVTELQKLIKKGIEDSYTRRMSELAKVHSNGLKDKDYYGMETYMRRIRLDALDKLLGSERSPSEFFNQLVETACSGFSEYLLSRIRSPDFQQYLTATFQQAFDSRIRDLARTHGANMADALYNRYKAEIEQSSTILKSELPLEVSEELETV